MNCDDDVNDDVKPSTPPSAVDHNDDDKRQSLVESSRTTPDQHRSPDVSSLSPAQDTDHGIDDAATTAATDWCAWCGGGQSAEERDEDLDVDETWPPPVAEDNQRRPRYDQLRFCSRACLSRYKMDLFCRETQRYLHQLQGSERLSSSISGGTGSDDASKDQRILITPELWTQPDPCSDHLQAAVRVDTQKYGDAVGGTTRRRRSNGSANGDDSSEAHLNRQKVPRSISICDRLHPTASRRPPACKSSATGNGHSIQPTYLCATTAVSSRTPAARRDDSITTAGGGSVKTECGVTDNLTTGSRPAEGLSHLGLPWMMPVVTSSTPAVPNSSLPSAFPPRGFFAGPLCWPHSTPPGAGLPPTYHIRTPAFATSMPLGFGPGGAAWTPPGGLVQPPTTMLVPYPIPIPLPLPLPIPIPVPLGKLGAEASDNAYGAEICSSGNDRPEETSNSRELPETKNCLSAGKSSGSSGRVGDRWSVSSTSTVATSSSSEACGVLDLSVSGRSTDTSSRTVWTNALTVNSSPYLARRSLILDAPPSVERKCCGGEGEHTQSSVGGGAVRGTSASVSLTAGKRFNNQHRRRTTQMPLVKSK